MVPFRFIKIHFNCKWEKRCVSRARATISTVGGRARVRAIIFPVVLSADDIVNFPGVIGFRPRCESRGLRAMKADYFHGDPLVLINNALSCNVNAADGAAGECVFVNSPDNISISWRVSRVSQRRSHYLTSA